MKAIYWILGLILIGFIAYSIFPLIVGFVKIMIGLAALAIFVFGFLIGRITKN